MWQPPDPSTATQSQTLPDGRVSGHFCLLSRITSADDPIIFPAGSESSVIDDNNISMKNEQVYSAPAAHFFHFYVRGAASKGAAREFSLVSNAAALPIGTQIELDIPKKSIRVVHVVGDAQGRGNGAPPPSAKGEPPSAHGKSSEKKVVLAMLDLGAGEESLARVALRLPVTTPPRSLCAAHRADP